MREGEREREGSWLVMLPQSFVYISEVGDCD